MPEVELQDVERGSGSFSDSLRSMTSNFLPGQQQDPLADSLFPSLTYKQRLYGWGTCFTLGCLVSFLSFGQFLHHLSRFAILYSFGNVIGLCSSFFLCGPVAQFRAMKDPKRVVATVIFITSLILTFIAASKHGENQKGIHRLIVLILVITQWCALTWYSLSFIPYGRAFARSMLHQIFFCFS